MMQVASQPGQEVVVYAFKRLGVILDAYTVCLDICVCGLQGNVLANGRNSKYRGAIGTKVSHQSGFRDALQARDGGQRSVADISESATLARSVAVYGAAVVAAA